MIAPTEPPEIGVASPPACSQEQVYRIGDIVVAYEFPNRRVVETLPRLGLFVRQPRYIYHNSAVG